MIACVIAAHLQPSAALAEITLPNGAQAPMPAPINEIGLQAFFAAEGEALDWLADAHDIPDTFSPLCDFTATLMLKESGSDLGVGFYNVVPGATVPPTTLEISPVVPAASTVGTMITGQSIRAHANYLGGLIGFALIRDKPPNHFSETKWNTVCNAGACAATPGPWIRSVKYKSVKTPNTFLLGVRGRRSLEQRLAERWRLQRLRLPFHGTGICGRR